MTRDDIRWISAFAVAIAASTVTLLAGIAVCFGDAPKPSITLPVVITNVHDGDSLTVEGTWRANIRLKDVWAKELREPGGKEALAYIQRLTKSRKCLLSIPLEGVQTVGDVLTFGRIIGEIWMDGECESVNMRMVRDGFATKEKQQ